MPIQITLGQLFLVVLCIFLVIGLTTTGTWSLASWRAKRQLASVESPVNQIYSGPPIDAKVSEWTATGECVPIGGRKCGKGTVVMERVCHREGSGGGTTCAQMGLRKEGECYKTCDRPFITDWGHPNDPDLAGPRKGWYDVTGQGTPNDYCRWVGDGSGKRFACQTHDEAYMNADRRHLVFSGGPANRLIDFDAPTLRKKCPVDAVMYTGQGSSDPDFKKSIANGFFSSCGARCVYDYRNPTRQGWWIDVANKVQRIDDMRNHVCGRDHTVEMESAIKRYEDLYEQKNAWKAV